MIRQLVRLPSMLARALPVAHPAQTVGLRAFSQDGDEAQNLRNAEKLVNLMSQSPAMQNLIMQSLPAAARSPEMVQRMLGDPAARFKLAEMISKQGFKIPSSVVDKLTSSQMEDTFTRASSMGINPGERCGGVLCVARAVAQVSAICRACTCELCHSSATASMAKYKDDKETVEVITQIQGILGAAKGLPIEEPKQKVVEYTEPSSSSSPTPAAAPAAAPSEPHPAASPDTTAVPPLSVTPPPPGTGPSGSLLPPDPSNLGAAMMSDPELARRLQNPRIRDAVLKIQKSPWKTVMYVLDKEVMEVFTALKNPLFAWRLKKSRSLALVSVTPSCLQFKSTAGSWTPSDASMLDGRSDVKSPDSPWVCVTNLEFALPTSQYGKLSGLLVSAV
eukprot:gene23959-9531_t